MKGHGAKFTRKKEEAVAALLSHKSVEEAARAVDVNPNTLLRWLGVPEFRDAYRKARREAVHRSVAAGYRRCRSNHPKTDDGSKRARRRQAQSRRVRF
jgi:transposase-like protein